MKARDIQVGDYFIDPETGMPFYVVSEILPIQVRVVVEYRDGGDSYRTWELDDDIPTMHRPGVED
jgi:hypothetical protein